MQHILILEDVAEQRKVLAEILHDAFTDIHIMEAATLQQARQHLQTCQFTQALIDIGLPDGRGTDFLWEVKQKSPETRCVIVTQFEDDAHLFAALKTGADGYLLKAQSREKFIAMLQGNLLGEPPLSPVIARRMLRYFQESHASPLEASPKLTRGEIELTPREIEVLTGIAKGLKRKEVAKKLGIKDSTIAGYIKTLYDKLHINSRAEAALEASRRGLVHTQNR